MVNFKEASILQNRSKTSPDPKYALLYAIMDALDTYQTMSTQALGSESERVCEGLRDILLGPAQLYEALRAQSTGRSARP